MKTTILYSTDLAATQKDIADKKGKIKMQFGKRAMVVALRETTDPNGIASATIEAPKDLDLRTQRSLNSWINRSAGGTTSQSIPWGSQGNEAPDNLIDTEDLDQNNPVMLGKVAVGVVIVEGTNDSVSWKNSEEDKVNEKVSYVLDWYQEQNAEANISFVRDDHTVTLDLVNDIWSNEQDTGARSETAPALAMLNDVFYLASWDKDSNEIEVRSSADGADWILVATLGKSEKNPAMTTLTVADEETIYIAYIDKSTDKVTAQFSTDGSSWTETVDTGLSSSHGPGMTTFNETVYLSVVDSSDIFVASYSNGAWTAGEDTGLQAGSTANMASWNGNIYMAYQNKSNNNLLVSASPDGLVWSAGFDTEYGTDVQPGIAAMSNGLVLIWKASDDKLKFGMSAQPISYWTIKKDKHDVDKKGSSGLTTVVNNGTFYAAYKNNSNKKIVFISTPWLVMSSANTKATYEDYWRLPALDDMGYKCETEYSDWLLSEYNADWAYVAYFTKYDLGWFAYKTTGRTVQEYQSNGLSGLFAHETGHIFGAANEYKSSQVPCNREQGYMKVLNKNSDYNDDDNSCVKNRMICVMDSNDWQLCSWTRGAIGWDYWGDAEELSYNSDKPPVLTFADSIMYMAWKDSDSNKINIASSTDGIAWTAGPLLDVSTNKGPAICNHNGLLYAAYQDEDSEIHVCFLENGLWSDPVSAEEKTEDVPSIVSWNDGLYIAYRNKGGNAYKLLNSSDNGQTWSSPENTNKSGGSGPSLTIHDGSLFMAWSEDGDYKIKVASTVNGQDWGEGVQTGDKCNSIPVIISSGEYLHLAYRGKSENGKLFTTNSLDGVSWDTPYKQYFTSDNGPGFAVDDNNYLYMAWKGDGKKDLTTVRRTKGADLESMSE